MPTYNTSAVKVIHKTVNNLVPILVEHELVQALNAADVLNVNLPSPSPLDTDYGVAILEVYQPSVSSIRTSKKSLIATTSYNMKTGVVTLTATGTIPIGSNIVMELFPLSNTIGT